jgi:archaellum component FlaG (FlaF/FlaG flagellin family)
MRKRPFLAALAAVLAVAGCGQSDQALEPSFSTGTCAWTIANSGTAAIPAPNNASRSATFFIKNTGDVAITITGHSASGSGTVTGAHAETVTFPFSVGAGSQIDMSVTFTTGSTDGLGFVFYTVTSSTCGGTKTGKRAVQVS